MDDDDKQPANSDEAKSTMLHDIGPVWSIGVNFSAGVAGMGLLGWLLDRWLGTAPWILLGGVLLGLIGGFYQFIREAGAINRRAAERFKHRDD